MRSRIRLRCTRAPAARCTCRPSRPIMCSSPATPTTAARADRRAPPPPPPPTPPPPPPSTAAIDAFILPPASSPGQVAVIDTGYIKFPDSDAAHLALTARVNSVPGYMLYSAPQNPHNSWGVCPPDAVRSVPGRPDVLDGVAGHGTFIAGIIASRCASAKLTVVGERRAVMPIAPTGALSAAQAVMVVTDELSLGRSLLRYGKGDVVSCGFAFPTLNTYPSIPVSLVMAGLLEIDPTWSHVAVMVAPGAITGRPLIPT